MRGRATKSPNSRVASRLPPPLRPLLLSSTTTAADTEGRELKGKDGQRVSVSLFPSCVPSALARLEQDKIRRSPTPPPSPVCPPLGQDDGRGGLQAARPPRFPPSRPRRRNDTPPPPPPQLPLSAPHVPSRLTPAVAAHRCPHTYGSPLAPVSLPSQLTNVLNKAPNRPKLRIPRLCPVTPPLHPLGPTSPRPTATPS